MGEKKKKKMEVQKDIDRQGLWFTIQINEKGVKERISFFHTLSLCYLEDENLYVFIW